MSDEEDEEGDEEGEGEGEGEEEEGSEGFQDALEDEVVIAVVIAVVVEIEQYLTQRVQCTMPGVSVVFECDIDGYLQYSLCVPVCERACVC
jgi:hypothetical protein